MRLQQRANNLVRFILVDVFMALRHVSSGVEDPQGRNAYNW